MSTEGNGSTGERFNLGVPLPSERVLDSGLMDTPPGERFLRRCITRYTAGDWGIIPPWLAPLNERSASNSGLAAGGLVVGIYPIPVHLGVAEAGEHLVLSTTVAKVSNSIGIVVTFVLFLSERDE